MTSTGIAVGPLDAQIEGGVLRHLRRDGVEIVRALSLPIRDENWGTLPEEDVVESIDDDGADRATVNRRFTVQDGALACRLSLTAFEDGSVVAEAELTAARDILTNRAGFTVLHPIAGVAGTPLTVHHPDGSQTARSFPREISPGQPAVDIAGLRHRVGRVEVEIDFEGEIFEMEDQRNWSDASYKTYCRPLRLPFPYRIAAGETVRQRVTIRSRLVPEGKSSAAVPGKGGAGTAPDILLALEPGWTADGPLPCNGVLIRLNPKRPWEDAVLEAAARAVQVGSIDVEVILEVGRDPLEALTAAAAMLTRTGIRPARVVALPEDYLKSHQPEGPWPDGPTPGEAAQAARSAFPNAAIGVGMLTNFTELNRCRPEPGVGDFITHGNSAIVHAADDTSVWETLEALPQIFASTAAFSRGMPYRLGLVSVGMRSNPYGAGLSPNPDGRRRTMTADDPRQHLPFAAAYAAAVAGLSGAAGIEAVCLGAPAGPFGLAGRDGRLRPIHHAVRALSQIAGRPMKLTIDGGLHRIDAGGATIVANCAPEAVTLADPPSPGAVLDETTVAACSDPDWIATATTPLAGPVILAPGACLFSGFEAMP